MADYGQASGGSVITLEEGSAEHSFQNPHDIKYAFNWHPRRHSNFSDCESEIRQAHLALSTAYNSLKIRLLKSESDRQDLQRELKSIQSQQKVRKGSESPTDMQRSPKKQDAVTQNDSANGILRAKPVHSLAREDGSVHQRHGSWGYMNDHLSTEEQYCKLMEIQLNKVEEERNRLQAELKEVRLKLTEVSLRNDQAKRSEQHHIVDHTMMRELEQKLGDAELQKIDLRKTVGDLQRELEDIKKEKENLLGLNRSLERRLREKNSAGSPKNITAKEDDVDAQTHIQTMTVLALQAVSEQQKIKHVIVTQQNTIKHLQEKLSKYTKGEPFRPKAANLSEMSEEPQPLIRQAVNEEIAAQGDVFGEYYKQLTPLTNGHLRDVAAPKSPKHTPGQLTAPKQPQQHRFAFDPIKTTAPREGIDMHVMNHKSPYQLREERHGENTYNQKDPYVKKNDCALAHSDASPEAFSIGNDETTMTQVHSEDITINLDPTMAVEQSMKTMSENENPPPSPCRKKERYVPHPSLPSRPVFVQERTHAAPMETSETSTSSEDVPVRRPPDPRVHGYVNVPGLDREDLSPGHMTGSCPVDYSNDKTSTGVHGGLHNLNPTSGRHYRQENIYVEPRLYAQNGLEQPKSNSTNTETGTPDVKPKMYCADPDVRLRTNPFTGAPPSPRKSNTMPSGERRRAEEGRVLSQSLPRPGTGSNTMRANTRAEFEAAESYPPVEVHSHQLPRFGQVGTTTYDGPRTEPKRVGHSVMRNDHYQNIKLPEPVENSESEEHESFRDKNSGGDSDLSNCIICNMVFSPSATLKQKEEHVNACLNDSTRHTVKPDPPECPVCKQVFPIGYSQQKYEDHVHGHFGENVRDRFEFIDADNFA